MHRDIKCANILIDKDGAAKLADFNVSKVINKNGFLETQTGTPYYASPEVWKDQPYDFKSDVWSLGCVLYEMAAQRPPFKGTDMKNLYIKVVSGQYPPLSNRYSPDFKEVIRLML
jgi:NIMA (never in mitosis gene a)-related kinase